MVGRHFWPGQVFRSTGLFLLTAAILAGLGGLIQVNPVWIYGPFVPYAVSSPAQPDWYLGWLEGSLRLGPNWEPTILGITIPSPFLPAIVIPGIIFTGFALWPFIEARYTRDGTQPPHPRSTAKNVRIATPVAVLTGWSHSRSRMWWAR